MLLSSCFTVVEKAIVNSSEACDVASVYRVGPARLQPWSCSLWTAGSTAHSTHHMKRKSLVLESKVNI